MPRKPKTGPGAEWEDASAGWVDASVPDLGDLLRPHPEIDAQGFVEWLGDRLGYYRASAKAQAAMPTATEEQASAKAIDRAAADLAQSLGAELTPRCEARLHEYAHALGADWITFKRDLKWQLRLLRLYAAGAAVRLSSDPPRTGRPSADARRVLLAAVLRRLREHMKAEAAHVLAQQILQRCGVPMPAVAKDTSSIKRAARKGGQKPS